jgi:hypothetical protein
MDNGKYIWTDAIEGNVFTAINARVIPKFQSKKGYESINCGTELKKKTTPNFPYIHIRRLPGAERGQTFEKKGIESIMTTFQIEVYSNAGESVCKEISNYIADIMTENLMFSMVGEPYPDYESTDEYRYVARYQRTISKDDYIKW